MTAKRIVFFFLMNCLLGLSAVFGQLTGFVENKGQWPENVLYATHIPGGRLFIEKDRLTYNLLETPRHGEVPDSIEKLKGHAFEVQIVNASIEAEGRGVWAHEAKVNYFVGKQENWASGLKNFREVKLKNVYPNIDMVLHNENGLKYDFILRKGARVSDIALQYQGVNAVMLVGNKIEVETQVGVVVEMEPKSWITRDFKKEITTKYQLNGNMLSFQLEGTEVVGEEEITLDPELIFATYSGSAADNFGFSATFDRAGSVVTANVAYGIGYPTSLGAYDLTFNSKLNPHPQYDSYTDIVCQKFNQHGSQLLYSTYIGGEFDDMPHSTICDEEGNLYVLGTTSSTNFPTTPGAYRPSFIGGKPMVVGDFEALANFFPNGSDMVVFKLSTNGDSLLASTFFGGIDNDGLNLILRHNYADEARGEIEFTKDGDVILVSTTQSGDYPVTPGVVGTTLQGGSSGVISILSPDLQNLRYSTFLGGNGDDALFSLDIAESGNILVAGGTTSSDLPTRSNAYQQNLGGGTDGWAASLSPRLNILSGLTYLGGTDYDQIYFIDEDVDQNIYVNGQTLDKTGMFNQNPTGYSVSNSGQFIAKFNSTLTNRFFSATYGSGDSQLNLSPVAFSVDICNQIYAVGWGGSINSDTYTNVSTARNLPVRDNSSGSGWYSPTTRDGNDMYFAIFDSDMAAFQYGSYLGSDLGAGEHVDGGTSRFDKFGNLYLSVCGGCHGVSGFPTGHDTVYAAQNGGSKCNNIAVKFAMNENLLAVNLLADVDICFGDSIRVSAIHQNLDQHQWQLDGVDMTSGAEYISFKPDTVGEYVIKQTITNNLACVQQAVDSIVVRVQPFGTEDEENLVVCLGESIDLGKDTVGLTPGYSFRWLNADGSFLSSDLSPEVSPTTADTFQLELMYPGGCTYTFLQPIDVLSLPAFDLGRDTALCEVSQSLTLTSGLDDLGYEYEWFRLPDTDNAINSDLSDSIFTIESDGQAAHYMIQVTTNECKYTDTLSVGFVPVDVQVQGRAEYCAQDTLLLQAIGGPRYTYSWENNPTILGSLDTNFVEVFAVSDDTVSVMVTSDLGCISNHDIVVGASPIISGVFSLFAEDTVGILNEVLETNLNGAFGYTWTWFPPGLVNDDGNTAQFSLTQDTTITVEITDGNCVTSVSKRFYFEPVLCGDDDVYLPNAFSPNQDGKNDILYVREHNVLELSLRIFDRWGNMVFETEDSRNGWDGTYEGELLKPAVFVYILKGLCVTQEPFYKQGNITLMR